MCQKRLCDNFLYWPSLIKKVNLRVESGLKELKKSDIAILDIEDEDEDSVNVGAVNFRSKKKFQGGAKPNNQGGQLKCSYCNKTGHAKKICIPHYIIFNKFSKELLQEVPAFRDFWHQKGITKFGDHKF